MMLLIRAKQLKKRFDNSINSNIQYLYSVKVAPKIYNLVPADYWVV